MSKNCVKNSYPWIESAFSFSDEEMNKIRHCSFQTFIQDEIKLPEEKIAVDYINVLNLSLKSLLKIDAFQEKKSAFRNKLINPIQFQETLNEIVIGGLLAQSNIPIHSFEYEYQYDNNPKHHKNLDICALMNGKEIFFELSTRADFFKLAKNHNYKKIPGIQGIDN